MKRKLFQFSLMNAIHSVFDTLNLNPSFAASSVHIFSICCRLFSDDVIRTTSSANASAATVVSIGCPVVVNVLTVIPIDSFCKCSSILFIYMLNRVGERGQPCFSPTLTGIVFDLCLPSW